MCSHSRPSRADSHSLLAVSPEPEFYIKTRDSALDQFLVLACDGVWDVMSNEDICNFITHRMKVQDNLEVICNEVIDTCLYKVSFQSC